MRAVLDTNVLLSYLLTPGRDTLIQRVVRAGLLGEYTLLLPKELVAEMTASAHRRAYLSQRIHPDQLLALMAQIASLSQVIPTAGELVPATTRDHKDDYLLVAAVLGHADYLVTGDRDLLVLERVGDVRIVTPHEFWDILAQRPEPSPAGN